MYSSLTLTTTSSVLANEPRSLRLLLVCTAARLSALALRTASRFSRAVSPTMTSLRLLEAVGAGTLSVVELAVRLEVGRAGKGSSIAAPVGKGESSASADTEELSVVAEAAGDSDACRERWRGDSEDSSPESEGLRARWPRSESIVGIERG